MTQNVYAVLGDGTGPAKVLQEGLRDALKKGDAVALVWTGKPTKAQEAIYDYILDNEVQFLLYYAEGATPAPSRAFRDAEFGVVQKVKNPQTKALGAVEAKGKVLFLWDNEGEDDQVYFVFDNMEPGTLVLALNDGLSPISTDDDIPEPKEPEVAKDEDDAKADTETRFTKAELEIMGAAAVKRYGANLGCKAATMKGIIAELFPEGQEEEEVDPTDASAETAAAAEQAASQPPVNNDSSPYEGDEWTEAIEKIDAFLTHAFGDKYTLFS